MPAHELVLCRRCDVMAAMLTGGFKESRSNEICMWSITIRTTLSSLLYNWIYVYIYIYIYIYIYTSFFF